MPVRDTGVVRSRLGPRFFDRDVLVVAEDLLGATITHEGVAVQLTELEAYAGIGDPGSHAHRGMTPRTRALFGAPGDLYVYFTYGRHWCANLVTGSRGSGAAVLLRAGRVVAGEPLARQRRGDTVHIFHRDQEIATHPVLPGTHQFRIVPEHGPGAIARLTRHRRSTCRESATHPGALPEVEVRDLACYEALCGSATAQEVQP